MIDTPNKNNLSNDVVIKGSIKFANEFIFDGNLEGDITSADGILDRVDELVGEALTRACILRSLLRQAVRRFCEFYRVLAAY
jgi:hypothetical protein